MSGEPKNDIAWITPPSRWRRREKHNPRRNVRTSHFPATGANVGDPGAFTPFGSVIPADFAAMTGIIASPTTDWPIVDQHVVLGDASLASWYNSQWNVGGMDTSDFS